MIKKINILISFYICLISISGCGVNQKENSVTEINPIENLDSEEYLQLISEGNGILVDVRTEEEMSHGVIGNPVKIDFSSKDFFEQLDKLPKDKEIYIYCAVGGRSGKAAEYLKEKGYPKIYNLKGGYDEWIKKGYPKN